MEALLASYSLEQLLIFISLLIGALISAWKSFDYLFAKISGFFEAQSRKHEQMEEICSNIQLLLDKSNERDFQIRTLMDSDKCRIRAEITQEWQKRMKSEKIDYFTLQYLQAQYLCYKAEGGNSYITDLMDEITHWQLEK